jgi:hypothetical protein
MCLRSSFPAVPTLMTPGYFYFILPCSISLDWQTVNKYLILLRNSQIGAWSSVFLHLFLGLKIATRRELCIEGGSIGRIVGSTPFSLRVGTCWHRKNTGINLNFLMEVFALDSALFTAWYIMYIVSYFRWSSRYLRRTKIRSGNQWWLISILKQWQQMNCLVLLTHLPENGKTVSKNRCML